MQLVHCVNLDSIQIRKIGVIMETQSRSIDPNSIRIAALVRTQFLMKDVCSKFSPPKTFNVSNHSVKS